MAVNPQPPPFWNGPGKLSVLLGTQEIDWACLTRSARLEPSVEDPTSVDTMCGPVTLQSGQTTWTLTLNTNEAFGPGGTEDVLRPIAMAGAPIPFKLEAEGYSASGTVLPQQFPWGGDANSTWEYDMSWPVQGQPIFAAPTGASGAGAVAAKAK